MSFQMVCSGLPAGRDHKLPSHVHNFILDFVLVLKLADSVEAMGIGYQLI